MSTVAKLFLGFQYRVPFGVPRNGYGTYSDFREMDTVHLFQIQLAQENFSFSPKIQF